MLRSSLSTKMLIALLPLLLALSALLALSVRDGLNDVDDARRGATLSSSWDPLISAIQAVEAESDAAVGGGAPSTADARSATDAAFVTLGTQLDRTADAPSIANRFSSARATLDFARFGVDADGEMTDSGMRRRFSSTERELIALGSLLPTETPDLDLSRSLTAVAALASAEQAAIDIIDATSEWPESQDRESLLQTTLLAESVARGLDEFASVAPEPWIDEYRELRLSRRVDDSLSELEGVVAASASPDGAIAFDTEAFSVVIDDLGTFRDERAAAVVVDADAAVESTRSSTLLRLGITLVATALAVLMAYVITRRIARRVRAVSDRARSVADEQLPVLVDTLRSPSSADELPQITPMSEEGDDEIAELASAFNTLQWTLGEVATDQREVLRRGVSEIFVTMARRNRRLVDRQLALLDELEADVEDPAVLADYYRIDHLATRMRRNSDSLLVLASAESRRTRSTPAAIDEVTRAAISEIEEYRRIDVIHLEDLRVRANAVADVAHLLAEVLDNATAFSPPDSRVEVTGHNTPDGYAIKIRDHGVGLSDERLEQVNRLLESPPLIGLSVEPTLGMSVISLLAAKYGILVRHSVVDPGTVVDIELPIGVIDRRDDQRDGQPTATPELSVEALEAAPGPPADAVDLAPPAPTPAPEIEIGTAGFDDSPIGTPTDESSGTEPGDRDAPLPHAGSEDPEPGPPSQGAATTEPAPTAAALPPPPPSGPAPAPSGLQPPPLPSAPLPSAPAATAAGTQATPEAGNGHIDRGPETGLEGTSGAGATAGSLPVRPTDTAAATTDEGLPVRRRTTPMSELGVTPAASSGTSRLDPDALRRRLAAFQRDVKVATEQSEDDRRSE